MILSFEGMFKSVHPWISAFRNDLNIGSMVQIENI